MKPKDVSRSKNSISPRRALLPLGLGTALSLIGDSTLYTVLPEAEIAAQLGVKVTSVGVILGTNRLVRLVFNPVAGSLYERFSRRWLLVLSMLIGTAATASYGLANGLPGVLVGRVLWGAAWAGIWVGAHAMILDVADERNRGRLNGIYQVWFFLGIAATALAGGSLTDLIGLRRTLWFGTGITGTTALFWLLTLPETKPRTIEASESTTLIPPSLGRDRYPIGAALPASIPYFAVRLTGAGVLASTTILWLGQFFENGFELGETVIPLATATGLFVALRTVTSVAGAPAAGYISDRLGRRWWVAALTLVLGAAGLASMNFNRLLPAAMGAFIVAVAAPGVQALSPAIIGDDLEPQRRSRALGIVFSFGDLGSALGPPIAFALLPLIELEGVYYLSAGLLLLAAIYALKRAIREPRRSSA